MMLTKIAFNSVELFEFILPAIPNELPVRLGILSIYFIAHYYKLQYTYAQFKYKYITP